MKKKKTKLRERLKNIRNKYCGGYWIIKGEKMSIRSTVNIIKNFTK